MNKQQKEYAKAKVAFEALEERANEIEQDYMRKHNIVNESGNTPKHIWCIDDEEVFNQANEATATEIEKTGLQKAREEFRAAEDELIKYGLSIMPAGENKQKLFNGCFGTDKTPPLLKIRKKIIDMTFKLDTKTI